jgi:hypothetical protein
VEKTGDETIFQHRTEVIYTVKYVIDKNIAEYCHFFESITIKAQK